VTTRTDHEVIENKLVTIGRTVEALNALGAVSVERLAEQPSIGLVIERDLWLIRDLAQSIETIIARLHADVASLNSYGATVRAGVIDHALAERLEPDDGPYHVLVQLCLDSDPNEVAVVVNAAVTAFREYVRLLTSWNADDRAQANC
jgi:hypothetical protein